MKPWSRHWLSVSDAGTLVRPILRGLVVIPRHWLTLFGGMGVSHCPPKPLDELRLEVTRLEVVNAHALGEHHGVVAALGTAVSNHDDLRHTPVLSSRLFSFRGAD
jgi:hypothetical protein